MTTEKRTTLISTTEITTKDGRMKTEVTFDHDDGAETTTQYMDGQITGQTVVTAANWDTNSGTGYNTYDSGSYNWESDWVTTAVPTVTGGSITITTTPDESFKDLSLLEPLLELVGKCIACGDEAEVLLCAECGVAVRELGRSKLRKTMEAIEEELG